MKICIIGAGGAGLAAGRHCLEHGFDFDIFEQTGNVGGTWVYTDQVDFDENGLPVHSSMYQNLRTNIPKEVMVYEDFPYPELEKSYITQLEVLNYIESFARKFNLKPYIKFYHHVTNVKLLKDKKWSVNVLNVKNKTSECFTYDAIMVCVGHYFEPYTAQIPGIETFTGQFKHSHQYRTPNEYKDKIVLVIGGGPSGSDISNQLLSIAKRVFISYNLQNKFQKQKAEEKPLVKEIQGNNVLFEDGTIEKIDKIIFCTGYHYSFPFLSENCGIRVDDNYVYPLYKQVVNAEQPTMAVIGIPFQICPFPTFDIQVRFFLATLKGHFTLPSKEEMLQSIKEFEEENLKNGIKKRYFHKVGDKQIQYFDDLAITADIRKIPPVISKLYYRVRDHRQLSDCFKVIDDDNFVQI